MFNPRNLAILLLVSSVLGQGDSEDALRHDFSLKVRVLGWARTVALFKITYRAGLDNALAIADISNNNLDIYKFATTKSHFKIDSVGCNIIKIDPSKLAADSLFPIVLNTKDNLLIDASSLLRLDGKKDQPGIQDPFQNTETFKLTDTNEIVIDENNEKKPYPFTIHYTRALAEKSEDQFPVTVRMESGDKALTYEIFDFKKGVSEDDFKVPDGYFCMTGEEDATPLPEFSLKTPSRLQFTKRGSSKSFRGWMDSRFNIRKEEDMNKGESVIIDMANNITYTTQKTNGRCTVKVMEKSSSITPTEFLYSPDTTTKMQLLKEDVSIGSSRTFVLANSRVENIFLSGEPGEESAIPVRVVTKLPNGQVTEDMIGGFTDEVDWEEFDVTQCLAPDYSDVFRIFFHFEDNVAFGNPRDFKSQLLGLLMEWTEVREPVRFINLQPYADGSFSFTILPSRENSTEPRSLVVVQRIVSLVKAGNAIVTKPDKSHSRVTLVTYETLGAPQATYRAVAVFWITFSISILSLLLGAFGAVIFIRRAHPQNYVRRQLGL